MLSAERIDGVLLHMVYASGQTTPLPDAALRELVEQSRARNEQHGITAMLIHQHGTFLHGLEGEADTARALFAKVRTDPRHRDVQVLVQIEVERRLFAGQPMGFYNALEDELEIGSTDGELLDTPVGPHHLSWQAVIALRLLTRFRS